MRGLLISVSRLSLPVALLMASAGLAIGAPAESLDAQPAAAPADRAPADRPPEATPPGATSAVSPTAPPAAAAGEAPATPATGTVDHAAAGDAAFRAGRYREAQADFARAVDARPDAPGLRYRLAVAAAAAGDGITAEREAAWAASLDPGAPAPLTLAAAQRIARQQRATPAAASIADVEQALADGRARTAARLAAAALADTPAGETRARLLAARGRALLAAGRPGPAAVALRTAAGLGVDGPRVWLALGRSYAADGQAGAAATCFGVVAAIAPAGSAVAEAAERASLDLRQRGARGTP